MDKKYLPYVLFLTRKRFFKVLHHCFKWGNPLEHVYPIWKLSRFCFSWRKSYIHFQDFIFYDTSQRVGNFRVTRKNKELNFLTPAFGHSFWVFFIIKPWKVYIIYQDLFVIILYDVSVLCGGKTWNFTSYLPISYQITLFIFSLSFLTFLSAWSDSFWFQFSCCQYLSDFWFNSVRAVVKISTKKLSFYIYI